MEQFDFRQHNILSNYKKTIKQQFETIWKSYVPFMVWTLAWSASWEETNPWSVHWLGGKANTYWFGDWFDIATMFEEATRLVNGDWLRE